MKKTLFPLLLLFFLLGSCGDKKSPDVSVSGTQPAASIQQNTQKPPSASNTQSAKNIIKLPGKTQDAEKLINIATQIIQQGDMVTGFEYVEKAILIGEKSAKPIPKAYIIRGIIYQDYFKNYQKAILDYEKYLSLDAMGENRINALERAAKAYFDWGTLYSKFFNASVNLYIDYYTYKLQMPKLVSSSEETAVIRYFRGLGYYLSGQFDKSISDLEKVDFFYNTQARIKIAACYYKKGMQSKAEQIWAQVKKSGDIPISSELLRTYLEVGKSLQNNEILSQSQKISQWSGAQKAIKASYNGTERDLGYLYYAINDLDQALAHFRNVDLKYPDFTISNVKFFQPSPFESMARIYFCKAREYYLKCIQAKPEKSDYYKYQIALCLLKASKTDEAVEAFNKVSGRDFKPQADINMAVSLYQKGDKQKAYQIWYQIANKHSDNKEILGELGYAYARLGIRLKEAIEYTGESDDPSTSALAYFQSGIETKNKEQRIKQFVEAIRILDESRPEVGYYLEKNTPSVLVDLANAYYQRKYFSESAKIWSHFLISYPEVYQIFNVIQLLNGIWQGEWKENAIPDTYWVNLSS